ncbi:MAG: type 2 isopentenyl-diphosphate Delta-isomerase [Tissierellia bacterium]|nr:type 2 isopentenyl-diphosphate Delta-isomerase [Tissierellia bacterium]
MREERKLAHIENYLKTCYAGNTLLSDIFIEHDPLPDLGIDDINTSVNLTSGRLEFPLLINAMTGGTDMAVNINEDLAKLAKKYGIAMAVGSQAIAIMDKKDAESFKIVREVMGSEGNILANMSALASVEDVQAAIDMIDANGVQLHLNPAQELVMEEGDRDFKGVCANIEKIMKEVSAPVIVKEVGFGFGESSIKKLIKLGVSDIDIGGAGGTNFIEIEDLRMGKYDYSDLYCWGNPTAYSIIKARDLSKDLFIIGSGGIRTSGEAIRAMVIGSNIVAMSGEILSYLMHGGYESADLFLEQFMYKFKVLMLLTGSRNIDELRSLPHKITGRLKDLLNE